MNNSQRRSKESARTPPASASSITGSVLAACTRATSVAAFGASTSSHCAPTVCMTVPMLLISTPSHNQRKARCRNGAQAEDSAATGGGGGAAVVTASLAVTRRPCVMSPPRDFTPSPQFATETAASCSFQR